MRNVQHDEEIRGACDASVLLMSFIQADLWAHLSPEVFAADTFAVCQCQYDRVEPRSGSLEIRRRFVGRSDLHLPPERLAVVALGAGD